MPIVREKQAHLWERDPHDWYVEPYECSAALFMLEKFVGPVWDPACGLGRIVQEAQRAGLPAVGSDIVSRSTFCAATSNFLDPTFLPAFQNIVMNPPFALAEEFVRESLRIIPPYGKVAVILPLVWLSGFSSKRDWLPVSPLKTVYPISPRPSMPPGRVIESGIRPGNGTKDFAWLVWQNGYSDAPSIQFMNTNCARRVDRKTRTAGREGINGKSSRQWAETY
jgi:hypothetical protein